MGSSLPEFARIKASQDELEWLKKKCPYFRDDYLAYLAAFRFKPEQIQTRFVPSPDDEAKGKIEISASGPQVETILWEVPLMACLSEIYFRTADRDWNYDGQERKPFHFRYRRTGRLLLALLMHEILMPRVLFAELAYNKGKELLQANVQFSEFGTRRRRSYRNQDLVVKSLVQASRDHPGKGKLVGTSNVHSSDFHVQNAFKLS